MAVCPIKSVTIETASFDTQLLEAMETGEKIPEGTDYQHGPRYLTETLRDAVFFRDKHTCLICGKNDAILRVHHIGYWKTPSDHTDRMGNLITVCTKCHTAANHKKGGKLFGWKPKIKPLTGAAFMNTVRWKIVQAVKDLDSNLTVHTTYGAYTKLSRREHSIAKTHANDAYCMGMFQPEHRAPERLKALQALLEKYLPQERTMSNLQFLSTLHPLLRQQVLAQESLLMKEENARRVLLTKQMLAKAQSPQTGVSLM